MSSRRLRATLAAAALLLAVAAAIAGDPPRTGGPTAGGDRVDALRLAGWIRDRRPGLRVIDARDATSYEAFHVPTAEHVPLAALSGLSPVTGETVVVYAHDEAAGTRAAALLRAGGRDRVHVLAGGVAEWIDRIMNPVAVPGGARSAEAVEADALSRYFGGRSRTAASPADSDRNRGC